MTEKPSSKPAGMPEQASTSEESEAQRKARKAKAGADLPEEFGGQAGPEPTRYGDWEKNGITSDF